MKLFNRLNINWYFVGAFIGCALVWRVIYCVVKLLFF